MEKKHRKYLVVAKRGSKVLSRLCELDLRGRLEEIVKRRRNK